MNGVAGQRATNLAVYGWMILAVIVATSIGIFLYSGYSVMLISFIPSPELAALLTCLVVFGILIWALLAGYDWAGRILYNRERDLPRPWPPFGRAAILLMLSAAGLTNQALILTSTRDVLVDAVDRVQADLGALSTVATRILDDPASDSKRAALESLLVTLRREIVENPNGPNQCGVGEKARIIIGRIQGLLPAFAETAGSSVRRPCGDPALERIYQAYADDARRLLETDPSYTAAGGPARDKLASDLAQAVGAARQKLEQAAGALDAGSSAASAENRRNALAAIEEAQRVYRDYRTRLDKVAGGAGAGLPPPTDVSVARDIGSPAGLLGALGAISFYKAAAILLLAVALDWALLFIFREAALALIGRGGGPRRAGGKEGSGTGRAVRDGGPRFLWVNP